MNSYQVETFNTEKKGPGTSIEETIKYIRESASRGLIVMSLFPKHFNLTTLRL